MRLRIVALTICAAAAAFPLSGRAQQAQPVTFFGEVRARGEWDNPGAGVDDDAYTYLRTRLGVRATAADNVRLVFQLQDSRVYGAPAATSITDLHQAYVDLGSSWRGKAFTTRVGRQEIALGNERLVGPVGWSNTGRTFDGVRVLVTRENGNAWTATMFAATVEERGRHFGTGTGTDVEDRTVVGAWMSRPAFDGTLEATALYDGAAAYRAYADSRRFTLDARYRSRAEASFAVDVEAAWQGGSQDVGANASAQDVRAWLVGARAGRLPAAGRRSSALVGVDVLSGDASPADGDYRAFSTMYATNHPFYGIADLFLDPAGRTKEAGLVDAFGSASHAIGTRTSVRADLHRFATQAGGAGEIGWELDVVAPVRLSTAASLEFGYTAFRAGGAAAAFALGADGDVRHWSYIQLRAAF
jgi:hypothetical protein